MVAIAKIVEYFKDLLLILCVFTTGKQVQRISGQRVRVRELSAKQANLIRERSMSSIHHIHEREIRLFKWHKNRPIVTEI